MEKGCFSALHLLEAGFPLPETTLFLVSQMMVRVDTKWVIGPGALGSLRLHKSRKGRSWTDSYAAHEWEQGDLGESRSKGWRESLTLSPGVG